MTPSSSPRAANSSATHVSNSTTRSNTNTANSTQQLGQHVVSTQPAASNDAEQIIKQITQQIIASRPPAPHPATDGAPIAPPPDWINALLHAEKTGVSPLNRAIIEGDFEMAQLLMKNGARANATIEASINHSDLEVIPLFNTVKAEANQGPCNFTIIDFILHKVGLAPRGEVSYLGANALTLAILCKVPGTFFLNLCMHAKEQDKSILEKQDAVGRTPLGVAVANDDIDHVRALLMIGANANTHTHNKKTPLLLAIANGNTQLMVTLLKAGANSRDKSDTNVALNLCFDKRKYADFDAYQSVSNQCRIDVFKFCCKKIKPILKNGTENDLLEFLQASASVMTDQRLAKLAAKAAKIPGALCKTMILIESMRSTLTPQQLLVLRDAAAYSGDHAIYDYAVRLDTHLIELIKNSNKPSLETQVVLNDELGRALFARSKHWVNELLEQGAVFDELPDIFYTYPLLAQLADLGDDKLLAHYSEKTNIVTLDESALAFFMGTQTGAGLGQLISLHLTILEKMPAVMLEGLCLHAVKLGSIESMKMLKMAGANLNLHESASWDTLSGHHNYLIKLAMDQHDIPMIRYLIEAGAQPTWLDIRSSISYDGSVEIYDLIRPQSPRN
ncbi:MAG: hypothetical protein RL717_75 [Pseudomonadota bacterium]